MQGNAECRGMGSRKDIIRTEEEKSCTAGYQPAAEYLCSERMDVGNGAPEKVISELETDKCTAGYRPETGSLCLGRMGVGKGASENSRPN